MGLSDAARRVKERAEGIGERVENKVKQEYRERREVPVHRAAADRLIQESGENEQKYREGKISKELYESRKQKYVKEFRNAKPAEQKIAHAASDVAQTVSREGQAIYHEVQAQRYSSQPRSGGRSRARAPPRQARQAPSPRLPRASGSPFAIGNGAIRPGLGSAISFNASPVNPGRGSAIETGMGSGIDFSYGSAIDFSSLSGKNSIDFTKRLFGR